MDSVSKIFLDNLPLKIGAVFFATLLWFHTVTEKNYEYNFEVERSVVQVPDGYRLAQDSIPTVEVLLGGKGKSLLECFEEEALYLDIDLSAYRAGIFEYPVEATNIILPKVDDLWVVDVVFPKFIRLELVRKSGT
ncbi:MAG: hypothetical protein GF307_11985 [candidate division Zixibacteria bacterium]|nr:hypothetical protein [candidate division Zixibacteria bacterium]